MSLHFRCELQKEGTEFASFIFGDSAFHAWNAFFLGFCRC